MVIGIPLFVICYVIFAIWFFAKATKGFIFNPEGNPTGKEFSIKEVIRDMSVVDFFMITVVNPCAALYCFGIWFLSKILNRKEGDE